MRALRERPRRRSKDQTCPVCETSFFGALTAEEFNIHKSCCHKLGSAQKKKLEDAEHEKNYSTKRKKEEILSRCTTNAKFDEKSKKLKTRRVNNSTDGTRYGSTTNVNKPTRVVEIPRITCSRKNLLKTLADLKEVSASRHKTNVKNSLTKDESNKTRSERESSSEALRAYRSISKEIPIEENRRARRKMNTTIIQCPICSEKFNKNVSGENKLIFMWRTSFYFCFQVI